MCRTATVCRSSQRASAKISSCPFSLFVSHVDLHGSRHHRTRYLHENTNARLLSGTLHAPRECQRENKDKVRASLYHVGSQQPILVIGGRVSRLILSGGVWKKQSFRRWDQPVEPCTVCFICFRIARVRIRLCDGGRFFFTSFNKSTKVRRVERAVGCSPRCNERWWVGQPAALREGRFYPYDIIYTSAFAKDTRSSKIQLSVVARESVKVMESLSLIALANITRSTEHLCIFHEYLRHMATDRAQRPYCFFLICVCFPYMYRKLLHWQLKASSSRWRPTCERHLAHFRTQRNKNL